MLHEVQNQICTKFAPRFAHNIYNNILIYIYVNVRHDFNLRNFQKCLAESPQECPQDIPQESPKMKLFLPIYNAFTTFVICTDLMHSEMVVEMVVETEV